ncbi:hypothetical protein BDR26DRAFT_135420 [Obelidium mucronatum]|nr:hypothetical protein BDR26DRAFT_135420 [Obelidium mucronatum]
MRVLRVYTFLSLPLFLLTFGLASADSLGLYFELDMVESGKSFLIDCLKCNPKSPHIWKLIYQIEDLGGQFGSAESVKRICLAEETLPETEAAFFRHVQSIPEKLNNGKPTN